MDNEDRVQKPVSWDLPVLNHIVKFRKEKELSFSDAVNQLCRQSLKDNGFDFENKEGDDHDD